MTRHDQAELYLRGWHLGDPATCIRAMADDFLFHNPRVGDVTRPGFERYFGELIAEADAQRVGPAPGHFMEFEDHVEHDDGTMLTTWVWWRVVGTTLEGAGVLKTTDHGVVSHRVAYHATPQW